MFTAGSLIGFASEGEFALATTILTQNIDKDSTSVPVVTVSGFLDNHFIIIDDEVIQYSSKTTTCPAPFTSEPACFTDLIRGDLQTEIRDHSSGERVYNQTTGIINQIVGFNIAERMTTSGLFTTAIQLPLSFSVALIKALIWDFSFLEGPFAIFKYVILYPLSGGFIWSIYVLFSQTITSIFRR